MDCPFDGCLEKYNDFSLLVSHLFIHKPLIGQKNPLKCPKCSSTFFDYYKFQTHSLTHKATNANLERLNLKEIYLCPKLTCVNLEFDRAKLTQHLLIHQPEGINCIYAGCSSKLSTYASAKNHFSIIHRHCTYENVDLNYRIPIPSNKVDSQVISSTENDTEVMDIGDCSDDENINQSTNLETLNLYSNLYSKINFSSEQLTNLYMTTYLKYSSKYAVQDYVIEEINNDIVEFIKINNKAIVDFVLESSSSDPILKDHAQLLSDIILDTNVFEKTHKANKGEVAKLNWKMESKLYTKPEEIELDDKDKFHYVPLLENLKCLLNN